MEAEKFLFPIVNKLLFSALLSLAVGSTDASATASADADDASAELISLIDAFDQVTGRFAQTIVDASLQTLEESSGSLALQRPKFRWQVETPFAQLIIADGAEMQIYDPDLAQLSLHDIDKNLGPTPLTILLGDTETLATEFTVSRSTDGAMQRFVLRPRSQSALFLQVELIFQGRLLERLAIWDSAGQLTRIQFSEMQLTQGIEAERFELILPEGTDVIRG
ncbi:MAG: outer membrane lipoprotein chaperone LolA [Candidatus Azotimanducaceae bacterium]